MCLALSSLPAGRGEHFVFVLLVLPLKVPELQGDILSWPAVGLATNHQGSVCCRQVSCAANTVVGAGAATFVVQVVSLGNREHE